MYFTSPISSNYPIIHVSVTCNNTFTCYVQSPHIHHWWKIVCVITHVHDRTVKLVDTGWHGHPPMCGWTPMHGPHRLPLWRALWPWIPRSRMVTYGSYTLHGTRIGQGPGNDGFLYYTMYCIHYTGTGTGTGTGTHCFLLCPSRSLSLSRSCAVCMSHDYCMSVALNGLVAWEPSHLTCNRIKTPSTGTIRRIPESADRSS